MPEKTTAILVKKKKEVVIKGKWKTVTLYESRWTVIIKVKLEPGVKGEFCFRSSFPHEDSWKVLVTMYPGQLSYRGLK